MIKLSKAITLTVLLIFGSIGYNFLPPLFIYLFPQITWTHSPIISTIVGVVIGFIVSFFISKPIEKAVGRIQDYVETLNASYILFGTVGAILGLIVAWLLSIGLIALNFPVFSDVLPLIFTVVLAYFGFGFFSTRREEIRRLFMQRSEELNDNQVLPSNDGDNFHKYKVLVC